MSKEMTPKDAIQIIQDNLTPRTLGILTVEFNVVKKALDRLEQLEIADRNNQNLVKTNVELVNKNLELQKENQDLKEDLRLTTIERNVCENIYEALEEKYFKLEKVIDILKDKFNFELDKPSPNGEYPLVYENYQSGLGRLAKLLTQQEYDLLKEKLESV